MPRSLQFDEIPEKMTADDFWGTFGQIEDEQLDFKRGAAALTTTIPAMAMTDGGLVVLGVDDDRRIVGCALSQRVQDRVTRYAYECGVEVRLRELQVAAHKVTLVAVPVVTGRIVTTPDGRLVRRVGGDCQPLVGDAMARFVRERDERAAEDRVLTVADVDEFDLQLVNRALAGDGRRPVRRDRILRAFVDLGVASPADPPTGPGPLLAAALLFAKDPKRHVNGAGVQLVRRVGSGPGPGPSSDRAEASGPLVHVLDEVLAFISKHTRSFEVVVGAHRESLPEYPVEVLREAVVNALAHRDYGLVGATVDVTIWDDRIEIQSPGGLPGHITVENMRDEHYSRNRRVMRVLKLLNVVEEYGEGVDRMYTEMEARLLEPPHFTASPSSVTVTLHNRFVVDVEDQVWLALLGHYDLSPAERRLLVLARREDGVTPRRLRAVLGQDAAVKDILRGAVAKGLVVRVGQAGGAHYVLSDEVVLRAGSSSIEAQSRKRQQLLDEIRRLGSLSTAEASEILGEDTTVVRHLLNDLVRAGSARAVGNTRARRYLPA